MYIFYRPCFVAVVLWHDINQPIYWGMSTFNVTVDTLEALAAGDDSQPVFLEFDDPSDLSQQEKTAVQKIRAADWIPDEILGPELYTNIEAVVGRQISTWAAMPKHLKFAAKLLIVYKLKRDHAACVSDISPDMVACLSEDMMGAFSWIHANVLKPNEDILEQAHVDYSAKMFIRIVDFLVDQLLDAEGALPVTFRITDGPLALCIFVSIRDSPTGRLLLGMLRSDLRGIESRHTRDIQFAEG